MIAFVPAQFYLHSSVHYFRNRKHKAQGLHHTTMTFYNSYNETPTPLLGDLPG
jgi:hypothetical protein